MPRPNGTILAVASSDHHGFSKALQTEIRLLEGLGVEGDAHMGETVKHRSRVRVDPTQPNLRQVHLIHSELFDEAAGKGFSVKAGDLGENITTSGIDLLSLPTGTLLRIGATAEVTLTGLRNPCQQINDWQPGLLSVMLVKGDDGGLIRKAGVMGIVRAGGVVKPGDRISFILPPEPHKPLERV
ncbi:MOSC domain-containing protein [Cohaesibacter sp. CAU 1516]|uniref:MOSC domain-containing protein n=1 Tax=Cohaesibacter sp. CAU 1516 TaxID=2576038 RepID=UPI0010FE495A|nr:MOSC domain-containing protein [Cohaesibacter sp. CAU 1516]TLP48479.1 MOSC domain-containing protein [Cohaesibacter sp. CAU 1516]